MTDPRRVLIVDENRDDRVLARLALETEQPDVRVTEADSLVIAAEALARESFDVIVTDYMLRDATGLDVVDLVRERGLDIPIMFLTGTGTEEVAIEAMRRGVIDYVVKSPAHIRRLPSTVERVLARKAAGEARPPSHERLRNLAIRLLDAREEERTRVAREIHDDFGQSLTGLKLDLAWLVDRVAADSELRQRGREMIARIDTAIDRVRHLSTELRPAMLDDLGLDAAVEWHARDACRRVGCRCDLRLDVGTGRIPDEVATGVFRILQEALTNMTRHAGATVCTVVLTTSATDLHLCVADDGRGVTDRELESPESLGLVGIWERATSIGGMASIGARAEGGTQVSVLVRLSPAPVRALATDRI